VNRARVAAACAALLTALLLQAMLIGPLTLPLPVSLPALLIAAIALVDGPGTGLAFGFATGLIADLGSAHPAGVFALCWLGVGVVCGSCATPRSWMLRDAITATVVCGIASVVATLLLSLIGSSGGANLDTAMRQGIVATMIDGILALGVVPLVRFFLHSETLRAPRPVGLVSTEDMR
jgi:rod shape-determining protein MreD